MRIYWALVSAVAIAGCATTAGEPVNEAAAAKLQEHRRTGDKATCLTTSRISSITAVDERTLLIRSGVNDYYVSDLSGRCRGVTRQGNRIEYVASAGQLCRGDILRIVDNAAGFLSGSCGMGSFERLEKIAPEGAAD